MFMLSVMFALLAIAAGLVGFGNLAALPSVVCASMFGLFLTLFMVSLAAALTEADFRRERGSSLPSPQ